MLQDGNRCEGYTPSRWADVLIEGVQAAPGRDHSALINCYVDMSNKMARTPV